MALIPGKVGVRFATTMVTLGGAANTSYTLHQVTPGRTAVIRKIMVKNPGVTVHNLLIGVEDFTQRIPSFRIQSSLDQAWGEEIIPAYEFRSMGVATADIVCRVDAAVADVIQLEVEEFE